MAVMFGHFAKIGRPAKASPIWQNFYLANLKAMPAEEASKISKITSIINS